MSVTHSTYRVSTRPPDLPRRDVTTHRINVQSRGTDHWAVCSCKDYRGERRTSKGRAWDDARGHKTEATGG